jgi:hypothetical protein
MLGLHAKSNGFWQGSENIFKAAYRLKRCARHGESMAELNQQLLRRLFTQIGMIMEDASSIALIWSASDELDVAARLRIIDAANAEISALLKQITMNVG